MQNRIELSRGSRPTVTGRFVDVGVEFKPGFGRHHLDQWVPRVRYEYSVDGREHSSERIGIDSNGELFEQRLRRHLIERGWEAGSEVTVHYDPDDEGKSALDVRSGSIYLLLFFITFGAMGVAGIFFGIRTLSRLGSNETVA